MTGRDRRRHDRRHRLGPVARLQPTQFLGLVLPVACILALPLASALPAYAQTNTLRTLDQGPANARLPDARQQLDRTQTRQQQDFSTRQQLGTAEQRQDVDRLNENVMRDRAADCTASDTGCDR